MKLQHILTLTEPMQQESMSDIRDHIFEISEFDINGVIV